MLNIAFAGEYPVPPGINRHRQRGDLPDFGVISSLPYSLFGFLVLRVCGRARTGIIFHLLLSFFVGVMSSDEASGTGTECPMIAGEMARRATDYSAFETSCGICVTRRECCREKQGCRTYNRLHETHLSSTRDS